MGKFSVSVEGAWAVEGSVGWAGGGTGASTGSVGMGVPTVILLSRSVPRARIFWRRASAAAARLAAASSCSADIVCFFSVGAWTRFDEKYAFNKHSSA